MSKISEILRSVLQVVGRPFSICCQCRAENPCEIISSRVQPLDTRNRRIRFPNSLKNSVASITPLYLFAHEQKHHEQNSWTRECVSARLAHEATREKYPIANGFIDFNWPSARHCSVERGATPPGRCKTLV